MSKVYTDDLEKFVNLRRFGWDMLQQPRPDLKLTKEQKDSIIKTIRRIDDLFINNFEEAVDADLATTHEETVEELFSSLEEINKHVQEKVAETKEVVVPTAAEISEITGTGKKKGGFRKAESV
jgi:hypothetical protein